MLVNQCHKFITNLNHPSSRASHTPSMDHENTNSGTLHHADVSPVIQHVEAEANNPHAPAEEVPTTAIGEQPPDVGQQPASADEVESQGGGSSRLEVSLEHS